MNGKYLLDTNIVIAIFAGDPNVLEPLVESNEVFLSTIVLGELYYGARKSTHVDSNIRRIDELAASSALLGAISTPRATMGKSKTFSAQKVDQFPRMIFGSPQWPNSAG